MKLNQIQQKSVQVPLELMVELCVQVKTRKPKGIAAGNSLRNDHLSRDIFCFGEIDDRTLPMRPPLICPRLPALQRKRLRRYLAEFDSDTHTTQRKLTHIERTRLKRCAAVAASALPTINLTLSRLSGFRRRDSCAGAMKEKRTEAELKALIMGRIRQHPEWHYITNVVITRPQFILEPHQRNWDVIFVHSEKTSIPEGAFRIAVELSSRYDLA
jgi:hypothetical protein